MRKRTYTLKFDQVNAEGVIEREHRIDGIATLEGAREAYAELRAGLQAMGYRTAHDRIVGPQGEVYATKD